MSDGANTGGGAPSAQSTTTATPSAAAKPASPAPPAANDNATTTAKLVASNDNAAPPEPRHKIKVRGEEREYSQSEILKLAEKADGAETRFREVSQREREINTLLERMEKDPVGGLAALVGDRSRAAQAVRKAMLADPNLRAELEAEMLAQYEYEAKSPDERKRLDEERENAAAKRELEAIRQRERQQQTQQMAGQYQQQMYTAFTEALAAVGARPTKANIRAMAAAVDSVLGKKQITREMLSAFAKQAADENTGDLRSMLEALPAKELADLIGDARRAELRKLEIEALKPKAPEVQRTNGKGKAPPERDESGRFAGSPKVIGHDFFRKARGE